MCCDLLENSYLCGISNNIGYLIHFFRLVVICLKIRTFVVSATTNRKIFIWIIPLWFAWKFVPLWYQQQPLLAGLSTLARCDLLENSYLCGISNNRIMYIISISFVVICLKIRTFVVSATTWGNKQLPSIWLWFAWKFVPLWYQQQPSIKVQLISCSCDLLENSYLCGISNNQYLHQYYQWYVVICLKIRTFVVSATTGACIV